MPVWPSKYSGEDKNYGVSWGSELGERTIVSSTFELRAGSITLHGINLVGSNAYVLVRGGEPGESCEIMNKITLDDGQDWEEPCFLQINDDAG